MIFYFEHAEKYKKGIRELAGELAFQVGDKDTADVFISVQEFDRDELIVDLRQGKAIISCGKDAIRFYRGPGLLCEALARGRRNFTKRKLLLLLRMALCLMWPATWCSGRRW